MRWTALPLLSLSLFSASIFTTAQTATSTAAPAGAAKADAPPKGYAREIPLWEGRAPEATGDAATDTPRLYYYPAVGAAAHSAVIVMPGGGYNHLVFEKEGGVEARWLAAHGVAAFVLQYRIAPYRFPVPMMDGERAVRYVRSHATEFGIEPDRIGVWGFSAGAHLAAFVSTTPETPAVTSPDAVDRAAARPDFQILAYGRFSMDPAIPRAGNMESLVGPNPSQKALDAVSPVLHVTAKTAPAFIYSTTGDQTVNSLNATAYYDALKKNGVPVELHIFEAGPHGTGMGQNLPGLSELAIWPVLLEQWMEMHNWMPTPTISQ